MKQKTETGYLAMQLRNLTMARHDLAEVQEKIDYVAAHKLRLALEAAAKWTQVLLWMIKYKLIDDELIVHLQELDAQGFADPAGKEEIMPRLSSPASDGFSIWQLDIHLSLAGLAQRTIHSLDDNIEPHIIARISAALEMAHDWMKVLQLAAGQQVLMDQIIQYLRALETEKLTEKESREQVLRRR